jgi:hypothetical protein
VEDEVLLRGGIGDEEDGMKTKKKPALPSPFWKRFGVAFGRSVC